LNEVICDSQKRVVVHLIEAAIQHGLSQDSISALRDGARESEFQQIKRDSLHFDSARKAHLYPCTYERRMYFPWNLVTVEGITFFLPLKIRLRLRNGLLDKAENGLVLKDEAGLVVLPRENAFSI
jgi:hypothetical protein